MYNGDKSVLKSLCERKLQESKSEDERQTWGFLKAMLEDDGTAKSNILNHLGYSLPVEENRPELDGLDESVDNAIERSLIVGDYKGAVSLCMSANKKDYALLIAHLCGPALSQKTRDQCLKTYRSPYMKVAHKDLPSLVNTRPPEHWKETLALLCTFVQNEEWSSLCNVLASKLLDSGNTLAATLCSKVEFGGRR